MGSSFYKANLKLLPNLQNSNATKKKFISLYIFMYILCIYNTCTLYGYTHSYVQYIHCIYTSYRKFVHKMYYFKNEKMYQEV